jgi:hypothetical protein
MGLVMEKFEDVNIDKLKLDYRLSISMDENMDIGEILHGFGTTPEGEKRVYLYHIVNQIDSIHEILKIINLKDL